MPTSPSSHGATTCDHKAYEGGAPAVADIIAEQMRLKKHHANCLGEGCAHRPTRDLERLGYEDNVDSLHHRGQLSARQQLMDTCRVNFSCSVPNRQNSSNYVSVADNTATICDPQACSTVPISLRDGLMGGAAVDTCPDIVLDVEKSDGTNQSTNARNTSAGGDDFLNAAGFSTIGNCLLSPKPQDGLPTADSSNIFDKRAASDLFGLDMNRSFNRGLSKDDPMLVMSNYNRGE